MKNIFKILALSAISVVTLNCVTPAYADIDFVSGLTTGVPNGSSEGMLGAEMHDDEEDNEAYQEAHQENYQPIYEQLNNMSAEDIHAYGEVFHEELKKNQAKSRHLMVWLMSADALIAALIIALAICYKKR